MAQRNLPARDLLKQLEKSASGLLANATGAEPALYWNKDIAASEDHNIFRKDWVCPGLAAEIPNQGDYLTFSIASEPIFCIRNSSGDIKTYTNVCRYRMMLLLEGAGTVSKVVYPYHAWTYDLSGELMGAGHMEKSKGFDKKNICLPKIRTEIWNGWIYVTLNPTAMSVSDALSPLHDIVQRYKMEKYVPILSENHIWKTNWKLLTENFMEGYHLPVAHKATVAAWFSAEKQTFQQLLTIALHIKPS